MMSIADTEKRNGPVATEGYQAAHAFIDRVYQEHSVELTRILMLGLCTPDFLDESLQVLLVASSAEKLEDGRHYFEVHGAPGYVYSVWQTDDPESADWRRVEDAIVEVLDHTVRVQLSGAPGPSNYYRVRADQVISVD